MKRTCLTVIGFCLLIGPLLLADSADGSQLIGDRLGNEWSETEGGITGRWVRRGNSETWDGTWANGAVAILSISISGDKVKISRKDVGGPSTGLTAIYEGTLASDGTIQGIQTVTSPGQFTQNWQGRIVKGVQATLPSQPIGDRLGNEWSETEGGITGRWVRRGNSETWDGTWANGAVAILTISISGNKVRISRKDVGGPSTGLTAIYEGTLASDGTIQGIQTVTSPGQFTQNWQGRIVKGVQATLSTLTPASTGDLGATLVVIYPGVCTAIWTRTHPGVYDAVTICQGPGNASFRETLTVLSNESQTVIINRPNYGKYRGTLSADRRTIRGTCDWAGCTPNYRWTAYIDWNWNDAPPLR